MTQDFDPAPLVRGINRDGRVARGERTRAAIVDAHAGLLRDGVLKPTGAQIAARAGVSLRALWQNFKDLEGLLGATTAWWLESDAALVAPIDPALPAAERIDRYAEQRARRLESMAPAARSAVLGEPFSRALAESRRIHVQRAVSQIEEVFAPELARAGQHRDALLKGLFVSASWTTWLLLRDDFGMAIEECAAVMRSTMTTLLGV
jgi:TetR/AcrR family transcriptional regulator of autoinduction and epiphytic fitness